MWKPLLMPLRLRAADPNFPFSAPPSPSQWQLAGVWKGSANRNALLLDLALEDWFRCEAGYYLDF